MVPSASVEPAPLRLTASPLTVGVPIAAVGDWLAGGAVPGRVTVNLSKVTEEAVVAEPEV